MTRSEPTYPGDELLHDLHSDLCESRSNHSQPIGRGIGDVDIPSGDERTAIIDPDCYGPPGRNVRQAQFCAEWQCRMRGSQIVRIKLFAARGLGSLRVEAGNSLRGDLRRRERGMFFHGYNAPVGDE